MKKKFQLSPQERIDLTKKRIEALSENRAGYTNQGALTRAWNAAWSALFDAEKDLAKA